MFPAFQSTDTTPEPSIAYNTPTTALNPTPASMYNSKIRPDHQDPMIKTQERKYI